MNYPEAEQYLHSLGNEVETMKLGLDSIRKLLNVLGDPQEGFFKVQVAGTNGKGSVCAFLDSICNTAGLRTGTFTSPHLISVTERVRINGKPVSEDDFARFATSVRGLIETAIANGELDATPTFFEQITAIALLAFADAGIEVAVLETGLGGRLDATTAADAEIAAITRIDLDHQQYLGDTIEQIAAEKAAIIGPQTRAVIIGEQDRRAVEVITARFESVADTGARLLIAASGEVPARGLAGRHQIENARVAIAVAKELGHVFAIRRADIERGLRDARHPGRLEYDGRYLFDGAHNIGGVRSLVAYLEESEKRSFTLIYGVMNDKDVADMTRLLFPMADEIILTQPANKRALTAKQIRDIAALAGEVTVTSSVAAAIEAAEGTNPELIVVTGSLYLIGEAKEILQSRSGRD
jgi:dihydrofolate synthase/folylpolyglutamate synthase